MSQTGSTAKSRYDKYEPIRFSFLTRARQCSELTLPTLIPPQAHSASTIYYTPWQGIGARGVNNLAAKLLLSLLPPNSPFFRLVVDEFTMDKISPDPEQRSVVDAGLAKIERSVQSEIEGSGLRSPVFEALKHLIVGGNVLLFLPPEGGLRVFPLDSYVCKRDPYGNVLELITREKVTMTALDPEVYAWLDAGESEEMGEDDEGTVEDAEKDMEEVVEVYTRMWRYGNMHHVCQEINGKTVPGSEGKYPKDKSPFIPLRWTRIDNEDYGRGYVEEYLGDLISLEGLSKAIVQASAAASKIVFLTNPNGVTRAKDIAEAESGDFKVGVATDVSVLQAEKFADMRIAFESVKTISERLSYAFLMNTSIQRQAERVTAEEIRFMAGELEDALGGVYSILSQEFQFPLVNRVMDRMTKQKKLPALPKGVVTPAIVTGVEALGRGHDLNKFNALMQALAPLGPQVIAQYMNPGDYINRVGTSLGIDMMGLVKSPEQIAQEQQQAQQAQQQQMMMDLAGKAVPGAVKGIADGSLQAGQAAQEAAGLPDQGPPSQ